MRSFVPPGPANANRSYGKPGRPVQRSGWVIMALACFGICCRDVNGRRAAERPVRIVVLGDSLSAGFGLAAPDALPAKLERALKAKGIAVTIENAGVSGDTAAGRPGAARLVGRRRDRCGDRRARRQ